MARHSLLQRFDFGWLYVLAGVAICMSALLVPAQQGLGQARAQYRLLLEQEAWLTSRLIAYDRFLAEMEGQDPDFVQRLAASQLNLIPDGDTPVLQDVSAGEASIEAWIESTVPVPSGLEQDAAGTTLVTLSRGSFRTLFIASGIMCIFFGVMTSMPRRERRTHRLVSGVDSIS